MCQYAKVYKNIIQRRIRGTIYNTHILKDINNILGYNAASDNVIVTQY